MYVPGSFAVSDEKIFRRSRFPEATLNLRVGGSIPPRLTTESKGLVGMSLCRRSVAGCVWDAGPSRSLM